MADNEHNIPQCNYIIRIQHILNYFNRLLCTQKERKMGFVKYYQTKIKNDKVWGNLKLSTKCSSNIKL